MNDALNSIINQNGISTVGAAFFTGLFGFLGIIYSKAQKNRVSVEERVDNVATAVEQPLSDVATKLDTVIANQNELQRAFRQHMQWHTEKEK